jgi:hypothetical protein
MSPSAGSASAAVTLLPGALPAAAPVPVATGGTAPDRTLTFAEVLNGMATGGRTLANRISTLAGSGIVRLEPLELTTPLKGAARPPCGWRETSHHAPAPGRPFTGQGKQPSSQSSLSENPGKPPAGAAAESAGGISSGHPEMGRMGRITEPGISHASPVAATMEPKAVAQAATPRNQREDSFASPVDRGSAGVSPYQGILNRDEAAPQSTGGEAARAGTKEGGPSSSSTKLSPSISAKPQADPPTWTARDTPLGDSNVTQTQGRGTSGAVIEEPGVSETHPDMGGMGLMGGMGMITEPGISRAALEEAAEEPEISAEAADAPAQREDSLPQPMDHGSAGASPYPGMLPAAPIVQQGMLSEGPAIQQGMLPASPFILEATAPTSLEESQSPAGLEAGARFSGLETRDSKSEARIMGSPEARELSSLPEPEIQKLEIRSQTAPAGAATGSTELAPTPSSFILHPSSFAIPEAVSQDLFPASDKEEPPRVIKPRIDHPEPRARQEPSVAPPASSATREPGRDPERGGSHPRSEDGTDTASPSIEMRNDPHSDETAGRTGQNLPAAGLDTAGIVRLETGEKPGAPSILISPLTPPAPALASLSSSTAPGNGLGAAPVAPPVESVNRFIQLAAQEAAVVRQWKPDALSVVLKPDAQTEITLNLTLRDGEVRAQAASATGNTAAWHAGWAELQQSLGRQGIKLAPLQDAPPSPSSLENQPRQGSARSDDPSSGRSPNPGREKREAFDFSGRMLSSKPVVRPAPRPRPGSGRLLENWA